MVSPAATYSNRDEIQYCFFTFEKESVMCYPILTKSIDFICNFWYNILSLSGECSGVTGNSISVIIFLQKG